MYSHILLYGTSLPPFICRSRLHNSNFNNRLTTIRTGHAVWLHQPISRHSIFITLTSFESKKSSANNKNRFPPWNIRYQITLAFLALLAKPIDLDSLKEEVKSLDQPAYLVQMYSFWSSAGFIIWSSWQNSKFSFGKGPRALSFTWWECCGLCFWHKPIELAHFFLFSFCVYFCLYGLFLPTTLRCLTLFFRSYFCLTDPFNYISLYESLFQPWCNPLWLTGLKAPTN